MGEPADPDADSALRDHILAGYVDFRETMSNTLEGYLIENGESVWQHLSHRIDALLEGKPLSISRGDLPDSHPESCANTGGSPDDKFVLGPDDVLRPDDSGHAFVPPRRPVGDWRTNGQVD